MAAHQVSSTSTAAGSAFQVVDLGSEGKGNASVKLGSFLHYAKPWCQDAQCWAKMLFHQQIPEADFLLCALMRQSRSRLIFMVSTYCGGSRKEKILQLFSRLRACYREILNNEHMASVSREDGIFRPLCSSFNAWFNFEIHSCRRLNMGFSCLL